MRILLRERLPDQRRWVVLLNERIGAAAFHASPLTPNESSELALFLYTGDASTCEVRIRVGDVLVASTLEKDRPDFLIIKNPIPLEDEGESYLACSGRLLRDWVGQTELKIEVERTGRWETVLVASLYVTAGKMEQEAFEALCNDIADHSAAILLDVYGKTFVGLGLDRRPGDAAPVAALQRVRQAVDQLSSSLRDIAHQPAYRLKTRRVREPALAEQSVSELTLEETCVDPTLAVRYRGSLRFREHVREEALPHFNLAENRLISGFLHFLSTQIADLRSRLRREAQLRMERRSYRHRRGDGEGKTWWESEDLPRIQEIQGLLNQLDATDRDLAYLRRYPFLPPSERLREVPPATPLIRSHRAYAGAYKVIAAHFQAFRVRLDDQHLLMRAKSLPLLYEYWCVLEVLRILQTCLQPCSTGGEERSLFRQLAEERNCFVVEFAADHAIDFLDTQQRRVRLRYVPLYRSWSAHRDATCGLLGDETERTPDLAIEIYPAGTGLDAAPELIVVLDAKYSSQPHHVKLDEVQRKYGKIGVFRTGRVLSRQVWAMTPAAPTRVRTQHPEWAAFCTVDNHGFWSEQFDLQSTVAGVVQAKPLMPAGRSPLDSLIRLLLKRSGIALRA
jgi:hypothetical protein